MADKEKTGKESPKEKVAKGKTDSKPKKDQDKSKGKKAETTPQVSKDYVPRLKTMYDEQVVPALKQKFEFKNPMHIPKLDKIVLNVGMGTLHSDAKLAESIVDEMRLITGQQPVLTKARISVSNFKLRQGMTVGCRVTLRGARMFEFFDRLISVVIPRIRDFKGLSERSFDGHGNYTFGVKEQIIFPEIDYDKIVQMHGMDITVGTTAETDEEAFELMKGFGFPFRRKTEKAEAEQL